MEAVSRESGVSTNFWADLASRFWACITWFSFSSFLPSLFFSISSIIPLQLFLRSSPLPYQFFPPSAVTWIWNIFLLIAPHMLFVRLMTMTMIMDLRWTCYPAHTPSPALFTISFFTVLVRRHFWKEYYNAKAGKREDGYIRLKSELNSCAGTRGTVSPIGHVVSIGELLPT
ncbi:unnamed protein product [Periconia digitata]|uniref:Uncharacterized protein n=1 Tax=Periconia digitata TaxID=1303443 RepID=A0A9W4UR39_9PLEO|nr:unnamed protein product [Periconia digitata]